MICSDDVELLEMLRIVRANGWDRNLKADQQKKWRTKFNVTDEFQAKYSFYDLGFNLRPTEITGFLGIEQLKYLNENISKREENFLMLDNKVRSNKELDNINYTHLTKVSNFAFPIVAKTKEIRDKYFNQFSGAGVEIRPMISGNMQLQPFYSNYAKSDYDLPGTQFIHENGFYFGNYPELTETDLEDLSACLAEY
jgi:CDP-4-dehydro-6-deoxyglucose reductase, E1